MGWPWKENLAFFFNINSDNFSLKTNFTANYCLIYKHQFQLHHHDTRALWERENDKLTLLDNHFCWKAVHQNRFNTWNSSTKKKTLSKALLKEEFENPFGRHMEQPLWHHTKRNIPESSLGKQKQKKDAICFLASRKRMSQHLGNV